MYKCDNCGREFKSKSGLTNHSKGCSVEPEIEVETIEEVQDEVVGKNELSDNIVRKIKKLQDARASTYDAESRHEIDLQIAELRGN